jgi:hypothetical protein
VKIKKPHRIRAPLLVVLGLGLLAVGAYALPLFISQPPEAQLQSFSVAHADPLTSSGINPADIMGIGSISLIPCTELGLLCGDPTSAVPADDISSLSYGWDFILENLPPVQFSVAPGTQGIAGSSVNQEANCTPPEPQADVFESFLDGTNVQDLDGDGVACDPANNGYGLILDEFPVSDNVDALAHDPCQTVDLDCDSRPDQPVFFTLAPGSPSLAYLGVTSADILVAGIGGYTPMVWADGVGDLSLDSADVIDALCIWEDGSGLYEPGRDILVFSLAAGSPTLAANSLSAADLLARGDKLVYPASALGLGDSPGEDIDALTCAFELPVFTIYLPKVMK